VAVVLLFFLGACGLLAGYAAIASDLPKPEELEARSATFLSTRIYDRNGQLLHEILDPTGGRRVRVPYDQISPYVIYATVATEDARFWQHRGVDPIAVIRAVVYNLQERRIVSGFSSIPQQLVRIVLLSPEERTEETIKRKVREVVLATEVSRRYSHQDILTIYLNEINYGSMAYGIEAAAQTFFGKRAAELNLAEASLLTGLPQAPAYWDPYADLEHAKRRQEVVLGLMVEAGYIGQAEANAALAEELNLRPIQFDATAPHFVSWVQQVLEAKYGADVLYRSGLRVTTTLDSNLQAIAQEEAQAHLATLKEKNMTNAALVAIKPATGEIVAMLGSADFYNEAISGQVNVALRMRQPGSSIKPVTYVSAFERGWTPATMVWDIKTEFTDDLGRPYVPKNYDGKEHGPVLVRQALAQSLNIPAVKALDYVGLPAMLDTAQRLGIESLNRPDYGLSLTLGGGEVTLLEMTGAYAVFANDGRRVPPVAILRVEDPAGRIIEEYQPLVGEQVINPQHAHLITSIMADNKARSAVFGKNSALKLSRPAAAKTGTTDDWRDAWTIGYTPDLVTGVWTGNSDNSETIKVTGVRGAGPIWHNFMERAHGDQPATKFVRPQGIQEYEISRASGSLPSAACPPDRRRTEIFASGQGPLGSDHDFHQFVRIDTTTNAMATEFCPANLVEEVHFFILPGEEGKYWANKKNIPQPPNDTCPVHTGAAQVGIAQPVAGQTVIQKVSVVGQATIWDFGHYVVEYGEGQNPIGWGHVAGPITSPVDNGLLANWDVRGLENRDYTLRVIVYDSQGNGIEARTWVMVQNPAATATPTWTPTMTPTVAPTQTPAPTVAPIITLPPIPTDIPLPTITVPPLWTPTPTPTSTPGPPVKPTDQDTDS
jgi:1A family penicillin-binding protein